MTHYVLVSTVLEYLPRPLLVSAVVNLLSFYVLPYKYRGMELMVAVSIDRHRSPGVYYVSGHSSVHTISTYIGIASLVVLALST